VAKSDGPGSASADGPARVLTITGADGGGNNVPSAPRKPAVSWLLMPCRVVLVVLVVFCSAVRPWLMPVATPLTPVLKACEPPRTSRPSAVAKSDGPGSASADAADGAASARRVDGAAGQLRR